MIRKMIEEICGRALDKVLYDALTNGAGYMEVSVVGTDYIAKAIDPENVYIHDPEETAADE